MCENKYVTSAVSLSFRKDNRTFHLHHKSGTNTNHIVSILLQLQYKGHSYQNKYGSFSRDINHDNGISSINKQSLILNTLRMINEYSWHTVNVNHSPKISLYSHITRSQ